MAHLEVTKALQTHGIMVDMIAATSAGAMTGTLCCSALNAVYLAGRFVHDLRRNGGFGYCQVVISGICCTSIGESSLIRCCEGTLPTCNWNNCRYP